jgi:pyridoxine/pyridoxamine 5'-phosphate oxidase
MRRAQGPGGKCGFAGANRRWYAAIMSEIGGPIDDGGIAATDDPMALFKAWMDEAAKSEPNEANAMASPASMPGRPDVRMVLLKDADARGFVFYTNLESAKGRELAGPAPCRAVLSLEERAQAGAGARSVAK